MPFAVGDTILIRHVYIGRPAVEAPARVIRDDDEEVVFWWPPGTEYRKLATTDRLQGLADLASGTWDMELVSWWGGDHLQVIPAGAAHSIWPFRSEAGDLLGWYCNLQQPLCRTADGFDTADQTLDIWAAPDLSSWSWKDEDELEHGRAVGLYSDADCAAIRAEGQRVIAKIEAGDPIFERWRHWRPDPAWPVPRL